jgi:hypothetical protein
MLGSQAMWQPEPDGTGQDEIEREGIGWDGGMGAGCRGWLDLDLSKLRTKGGQKGENWNPNRVLKFSFKIHYKSIFETQLR